MRLEEQELLEVLPGVFAFEHMNAPPSVVWDYQQDDVHGTVTGITFGDPEIVSAFAGMSVAAPERFGAWYGHLWPRDVSPGELLPGEWCYQDGMVYVAPPEGVSKSETAARLAYLESARGVFFVRCDGLTIRNIDFVGFANPTGGTAAVFTSGCTRLRLENLIAYDSGYRAFNTAGDTGSTDPLDVVITGCVAAGDTIINGMANNPFVAYNGAGCFDCGYRVVGGGIAAYPWMDWQGRPLVGDPDGLETPVAAAYKPNGFYSHAGAQGVGMSDMEFSDFFVVSFCQMLNEKHGLSMFWPLESIGRMITSEASIPIVGSDAQTYPIRFVDSVFLCLPLQTTNVMLDRCRIRIPRARGGLAGYQGLTNRWFQPQNLYVRSSEIFLRELASPPGFGMFNLLGPSNTLVLELCTIVKEANSAGFRSDSLIRSADGAMVRVWGCVLGSTRSDGLNQHFLYRPVGPVVQMDFDPVAWSGIDVKSSWFVNYSPARFAERFGTASHAGQTFAQFSNANLLGGAILDFVTGEQVFGVDPGFAAMQEGDFNLDVDSPIFALTHDWIDEFEGIFDLYGKPYSGRYGAVQNTSTPCLGDANGDGVIDLNDLNIVLTNFGMETSLGDVNNDGVVDLNDLNIVLSAFGASCGD